MGFSLLSAEAQNRKPSAFAGGFDFIPLREGTQL